MCLPSWKRSLRVDRRWSEKVCQLREYFSAMTELYFKMNARLENINWKRPKTKCIVKTFKSIHVSGLSEETRHMLLSPGYVEFGLQTSEIPNSFYVLGDVSRDNGCLYSCFFSCILTILNYKILTK